MIDVANGVFRGEPARLARMLDDCWDNIYNWSQRDLGAILQHQLDTPLDADQIGHCVHTASARRGRPQPTTFGDLFRDEQPALGLLHGVKEFAKSHLKSREGSLPRDIAKVLYFASVLAARLRRSQNITRLSDEKLLLGVNWVLEQPWLVQPLQKLFLSGRKALTTRT
jgi:hypothetical protein